MSNYKRYLDPAEIDGRTFRFVEKRFCVIKECKRPFWVKFKSILKTCSRECARKYQQRGGKP